VPVFDAEVRASGRGSHAVVVPRAVLTELGTRRVVVRIGTETFESTLGTYGGRTFLGLRKAVLTAVGAAAGDTVHVELEPGTPAEEPQPTEAAPLTCPELEEALATDAAFREAWSALPDGHREEYGRWVSSGPDTGARLGRIARVRYRLLPAGDG